MEVTKNDYAELARVLVEDFYVRQSTGLLTNLSKRNYDELSVSREKIKEELLAQMSEYVDADGNEMTDEQKAEVLELVRRELWGYGIIDELIHDMEISDIKTYSAGNIRIKRMGK